uniref:Fe2OG dioxygenase domain-containing protein n=1 Tax=viral metagenome TaxID=1070528 RepID=A0A6C0BCZ6_9ZZZZ
MSNNQIDDKTEMELLPIISNPNQQIEWMINDSQNGSYACILRNSIPYDDTVMIWNICQRDCTKRYPNKVYGNTYLQPRVQCVYADSVISGQSYSNQRMPSIPWDSIIYRVKNFISRDGFNPNSCLVNGYIDGKNDYVSWHRDKEMIDERKMVCTVSIGGTRKFVFRNYHDNGIKIETFLHNGDIVYFWGNTNRDWEHSIPKPLAREDKRPRYSLTFRVIEEK